MNDEYTRKWIVEKAQEILSDYSEGITVRQLHYRLVALGMTNDVNHYKRVVKAMTVARWDNTIEMTSFIDRERSMYGETDDDEKNLSDEIETGKHQIKAWMDSYYLNRWSNQTNYVEVGIEKKALQGVFESPCLLGHVGLAPYKGYPSITFLHDAYERFYDAKQQGKNLILLYFGDYDPSGADIPRSIKENLMRMGLDLDVKRIALNPDQIEDMNLSGVPPKQTDSRTKNWEGGRVVECDAVEPRALAKLCKDAIKEYFSESLYGELKEKQGIEREQYRSALKVFVGELGED